MRPAEFIIKEGNECLASHSGLALVGALLNKWSVFAHASLKAFFVPRIQVKDRACWKIEE